jgi:transcription antitermination protein NusB
MTDSDRPDPGQMKSASGKEPSGKPPSAKKTKLSERHKARRMILQALYQWQMAKGSVSDIKAEFRGYYQGKIDWAFFNEAFPAIVQQAEHFDEMMRPMLDRSVESLDPVELSLLRMGLFELEQRIDVPFKVVINETVELARVFGATDSHKYINGILDRAARSLRAAEQGSG